MARTETKAAERARQRKSLVDQVSAEVGRRVSGPQAEAYRQGQRRGLPETNYRINDKVVHFEDANKRLLGEIVCKVIDYKIVRGGLALLSLQTSAADYAHVLADAAVLSQGRSLLATLHEISPKGNGDDGA